MPGAESAIGDFLRARRESINPDDFDLPSTGRRRVKGLRREELAFLAGVSTPYYTRLEQGHDRHPSAAVLEALARVLNLDDDAVEHLRRLATSPAKRCRPRKAESVRPGLQQLVASWTEEAAVVIGRYRDVLAANPLAQLLNPAFEPGQNLLRDAFLDPNARETYLDWDDVAGAAVAGVRATAGDDPDDPVLRDLIGELSIKSDDFRRMWSQHNVRIRAEGQKRFNNPFVGELALSFVTFGVTGARGQTLFVFRAEEGGEDAEKLGLLIAMASQ